MKRVKAKREHKTQGGKLLCYVNSTLQHQILSMLKI